MEFIMIILLSVFAVFCFYMALTSTKKTKKYESEKSGHEDQRTNIFENYITEAGFKIEKYLEIGRVENWYHKYSTNTNHKIRFAFDNENKAFFIMNFTSNDVLKFNYSDLIEFELKEDNQSIVQGRVGSSVVGGIAFGAAGAIVGSSRSRKIKEEVSSVSLVIRLSDFDMPSYQMDFTMIKLSTKDPLYINLITQINSIIDYLIYIKNYNESIQ